MKNTIFVVFTYIFCILFFQNGYTRIISIESNDIPDELIYHFDETNSIVNSKKDCGYNKPLYCKDDVCVCINDGDIKPFIELPDKNGYIHKYILIPYTSGHRNIISEFIESNNNINIHVSTNCTTDSQCFLNKCIENTCEHNIKANVERCDIVYTKPSIFSHGKEYLNCGRMLGEICLKDSDCSFNSCKGITCSDIRYIPSDTDVIDLGIQKLCFYDVGKYFVLDNVPNEAYLFSIKDCIKTYICKSVYEGFWGISDDAYNCYYKSEVVDGSFGPSSRVDPDQYTYKGKVIIKEQCYYTSDGKGDATTNGEIISNPTVRYYDIDHDNNRALTEYGWCDFTYEENDANWMSKLNETLVLNQINIPGTHDSGTYAIHHNSIPLIHGFRSNMDIRLETNKYKQVYVTHNGYDCTNLKTGNLCFLTDVFDEIIDFLHLNPTETVIIHLKEEKVSLTEYNNDGTVKEKGHFERSDFYKAIADITVNNNSKKYNKLYKDYFFVDNSKDSNNVFLKLGEVRGKIILYERNKFSYTIYYNDNTNSTVTIGKEVKIPAMGVCTDKRWKQSPTVYVSDNKYAIIPDKEDKHKECYPERYTLYNQHFLVQDFYDLSDEKKM
ncbi:hypothetical protein BCR36DRAFT_412379 [Piromyces finnis]|uniref:Phosphatidylinositol-specific phospholipase C X domain-containing protein n=1 Tax=Piromyces finnis TaxID=1754191 RepID=A0A1Y1VAJ1_9FUNG|nr:hypothetical protein BCR36DRAFT_412379 [Piromyces finnis]|eukprot:ORX50355.1 hypothetical protein BCR36DRAFT_412379 [Piromyces finnis]